MGALDFTAMADLLKYVYNDEVVVALNNNFPMLKRWKGADARYRTGDGKAFLIPIRVGRGNSFGGIADGGAFPTYDAPDTAQAVVNVKYLAGTYRVTGPSIAASGAKRGAVKSAMDFARDSLIEDINNRTSKYLMLDGTGVLCQVSNVAGTTITLAGAAGFGTFFLEVGEYVASVTTGGAFVSRHQISSIDHSAGTIVVDSAGSIANTNYLVYCRSDATTIAMTDYNKVPAGLGFKGGMLDATGSVSYEGLTATANPRWKPTVVAAGGNPLSQDYLDLGYLNTRNRGGRDPSLIVANDGMVSEFRGLIEDQRRYTDLKVPLGAKEVTYSMFGKDIKVFFDRFVPNGYVAFLDESSMLTFESKKPGFDDMYGGSTLKYDGTDAATAVWTWYTTFGTDARQCHGVISGLAQTNVIRPDAG